MQKSYSLFILAFTSLSLTLHAAFKYSGADWDDIIMVKGTTFARKNITCGVFSYSSNDDDRKKNLSHKTLMNGKKPAQKVLKDLFII